MTTLHDVIRTLVRGGHVFSDEENARRALLAVDAHEKGFPDAETYQAELDKQAAAARRQANPGAPETDKERADRLEAELTRIQANQGVQASAPAAFNRTPDTTPGA